MRSVLLSLLVLLFAACDVQSREERELDRAERELEQAQEELAEAREQIDGDLAEARKRVRDARKHLREAGGRLDEDLREDLEDAREDIMRAREDIEEAFDEADIGRRIGEALEEVGRALKTDSDVQPVDFRTLRDLLPDEIDGMEREDVEGENAGALGIRLSHVRAHYDGVGREIDLAIVDLGTLHGAASAGLDWLDANIDRETEDGYERTTEINGHPMHISVERRSARSEIEATVLVEERFVVHIEAEGRDLPDDLVEEILDELEDLEDLG